MSTFQTWAQPITITPDRSGRKQARNRRHDTHPYDYISSEATQASHAIDQSHILLSPAQINWQLMPGLDARPSTPLVKQGIQLRSSGEEEVQYYWQSIPLSGGLSLVPDLSFFTSAASNDVRLHLGTAPLQLGLPSAAGALELQLRPGIGHAINPSWQSQQRSSQWWGQYDQWGDWHTRLGHDSTATPLLIRASLAAGDGARSFASDNGTPLLTADDREEKYRHNAFRQQTFSLVTQQNFLASSHTTSLLMAQSEREIPNLDNSPLAQSKREQQQFMAGIDGHRSLINRQQLSWHTDVARGKENFDDSLGEWGPSGAWESRVLQWGSNLGWQLPYERWLFQSTLHWRQAELERQQTSASTATSKQRWVRQMPTWHGQVKYFFPKVVLEANARLMMVEDLDQQSVLANHQWRATESSLGVRWNYNPAQALLLSWQDTVHIPSMQDFFGEPGRLQPNSELTMERLRTIELAHQWQNVASPQRWNMHLGAFQRWINDPLSMRTDAFGQRQRINWDRARIGGFEWRASGRLFDERLLLTAAHTYQRPQSRSTSDGPYLEMPGRYRWLSSLQAMTYLGSWSFGPQWILKRQGVQEREGQLLRDNVSELSALAHWYPPHQWWDGHVGLRVTNLTNKASSTSNDQLRVGRSAMLDASIDF